ncbi:hypothetical protein ACQP2P_03210 [Dactylosporangium sp. CA-139114]|uniref:hypothetical protein n=1 Tax=Dactylosporangium sp. CA-139114 TaxID=3239931 RepID=UPI003D97251C
MKRRWIVIGVVAWAVVVAGFALYSYSSDPPTAREQTTIADALPTVDTALGRIYAALDPAASVATLDGYRRTEANCRVTSARQGTRFSRELMVYVHKDAEAATLDRVRAALPARFEANVAHNGSTHLLSADAGNFVAVRGTVTEPGILRFSADTGCRVQQAAVAEATPPSPDADRAPVQAVLATLGRTASDWRAHRLTSPACAALRTVEAVTSGDGAAARASAPAAAVVLDTEQVFAYRAGAAGVVLRKDGDALVVSASAGC